MQLTSSYDESTKIINWEYLEILRTNNDTEEW